MSILYKVYQNGCSHILEIIPSTLYLVLIAFFYKFLVVLKSYWALSTVYDESPSYGPLSEFGLYGVI